MPDRLLVDLADGGHAAVQVWPDGEFPQEVSRGPLVWPLDADALEDLRWYLEDYLRAPFGVWEDRGPAVQGRLAGWGDQVFGSVFGSGPAHDAYQRTRELGLEVVFRSAEPGLLGLPCDRIRCAKDTGLRGLPLHGFTQNQIWCELVAMACELLAWMQMLVLDGPARAWEPKRLRLRLFSTAGRIVRGGRRLWLRFAATWPWATQVTTAIIRLQNLAPG